jgi:hypothetical protein
MLFRWLAIVFLPGITLADRAEEQITDFHVAAEKAALQSENIREASGLAVSSRDDGFFWIVNDSGSAPAVHLIESGGADRGKVTVANARNIDWEDLVSFSIDGTAYLLAADTGDNDARRDSCTLYILREPRLPAAGKNLAVTFKAEWKIDFRYEGGPRDCEAVAVDVPGRKILLLSKRTNPPEVHELPLMPQEKRGIITTRKTGVIHVPSPADSLVPFGNQPTGFDITPDNSLAAVVTYYGVFLFPRKPDESWAQALSNKATVLAPHCLPQAESVAFCKDGKSILVISEGRRSPIVRFQRKSP